jgi:hypothetical protein
MKRLAILGLVIVMLAVSVSTAMAAKPQDAGKNSNDVIARSNGFPSGMHFNLNIHGKKAGFDCCSATAGGNSVFVAEYGEATIEYVSNKNSSVYELTVLDPCAMPEPDCDGLARVQLPYKIQLDDGSIIPAEGYYVFARMHGKPNNASGCEGPAKDCPPSSIVLYPNIVTQACSDVDGTHLDCLWTLGLVWHNDIYVATEEEFVRFDPIATKGKGKSTAKDITRLFTWSGWVFYGGSPDTNGDGFITVEDIPADAPTYVLDLDGDSVISLYEWKACHADFDGNGVVEQADLDSAIAELPAGLTIDYVPDVDGIIGINLYDWQAYHPDSDGDGDIDQDDVLANAISYVLDLNGDGQISVEEWLEYHEGIGTCTHYDTPVWIFDIADLVVTQQQVDNDGTKLLQVRFYPVATTEYVGPGYITVDKVTVPPSEQEFSFTLSGGPDSITRNFALTDAQEPYDSSRLQPGTYEVSEIPVVGVSTTVEIRDPDGESYWDSGNQKAVIDLDPGETVIVIFTNTVT